MTPVNQTKFHDPGNGVNGNCMAAALASILELQLSEIPEFENMGMADPSNKEWFDKLTDWLLDLGFELIIWYEHVQLRGYYLCSGLSDRGFQHQIIYRDGKMVHDPHPDKTGIHTITDQWALLPLDPAHYKARKEKQKQKETK